MPADGWFEFTLATLATWRLTHLFAFEDGPFDVIVKLRVQLGDGIGGRLLDCPYCLSLWLAMPFAAALAPTVPEGLVLWLAISGAVCIAMRMQAQSPTVNE